MRQIFKYTLGLLALLLVVPSCKKNEIEEPTLDLSTNALTFAKTASDQTVTVQTNKENWNAFVAGQSDWITLEQQGTSLKVKVVANDGGSERRSVIVVNAGGLQKQISVRQSAGDAALDVSKSTVTFDAKGGSEAIAFASNSRGVKVEVTAGADWLSVGTITQTSFTVTTKANAEKDGREGKITLTLGTTIKEVSVIQEGTAVYILPFLDQYPARLVEVHNYEVARGSALVSSPDGLFNTNTYRYATKSEIMPVIQYEFAAINSPNFAKASVISTDAEFVKAAAFNALVGKYGFVKGTPSSDGKTIPYTNDKVNLSLTVSILSNGAQLDFIYQPKQTEKYETFKTLPLLKIGETLGSRELKREGKKRADVQVIETANKSKLNTGTSTKELDFFDVPEGATSYETEIVRGYFYIVAGSGIPATDPYIDVVQEVLALYPNYNLGFWQDKVDQKYYPTDEFKKLMTDNGYPFLRTSRSFYIFYNDAEKKAYFVGVGKYEQKIVLNAHLAIIDLGKKNALLDATRSRDLQSYFRALDKEQYARDKALDRIIDRIQKTLK